MLANVLTRVNGLIALAISLSLRGIPEGPQDRVDAGLVPRPLGLEPLQDIAVDAQRHRGFGGQGLQPTADNAMDDMLQAGLGVLLGQMDVFVGHGFQTFPIRAGCG